MLTSVAIFLAVVAVVALVVLARTFFAARGARVVTCPENDARVVVSVDARRAAVTSLLGGTDLRLQSCTRWPEKAGCGQDCLGEIEASSEGCLVRGILERWYDGKECAICQRAFTPLQWAERKPALKSPDGATVEWKDVAPDALHEILTTHDPVCFDCHAAETLRRLHPDRVLDRPWDRSEPTRGR